MRGTNVPNQESLQQKGTDHLHHHYHHHHHRQAAAVPPRPPINSLHLHTWSLPPDRSLSPLGLKLRHVTPPWCPRRRDITLGLEGISARSPNDHRAMVKSSERGRKNQSCVWRDVRDEASLTAQSVQTVTEATQQLRQSPEAEARRDGDCAMATAAPCCVPKQPCSSRLASVRFHILMTLSPPPVTNSSASFWVPIHARHCTDSLRFSLVHSISPVRTVSFMLQLRQNLCF